MLRREKECTMLTFHASNMFENKKKIFRNSSAGLKTEMDENGGAEQKKKRKIKNKTDFDQRPIVRNHREFYANG